MQKVFYRSNCRQSGFSMVELMVVLSIILIMTTVAIFYATAHRKLYKPDEQALALVDMLQEARQRALTQRVAMRVEINLATNIAYLYNENGAATTTDDALIRKIPLYSTPEINIGTRPSEITVNPPEPLTANNAVFKASVYTPSVGQSVCTIRFLSNGTVVDAGTNALGSGAVVTGLTLHIWTPNKTTPTNSDIARSITVLGATGSIRMWEYDHSSTASNKWINNRKGT